MFIAYPTPMTGDQLLRLPETATFWHVSEDGVTAFRLSDRDERVVKSDDKTLALAFLSDGGAKTHDVSSLYFNNGDVFLHDAYASEQDARRIYDLRRRAHDEELDSMRSLDLFDDLTNPDSGIDRDACGYVLFVRGFANELLAKAFAEGEQVAP